MKLFSVEIINKPDFLEVTDTDSCKHISLLKNIVDEDKFSTIMENSNAKHSEANNTV